MTEIIQKHINVAKDFLTDSITESAFNSLVESEIIDPNILSLITNFIQENGNEFSESKVANYLNKVLAGTALAGTLVGAGAIGNAAADSKVKDEVAKQIVPQVQKQVKAEDMRPSDKFAFLQNVTKNTKNNNIIREHIESLRSIYPDMTDEELTEGLKDYLKKGIQGAAMAGALGAAGYGGLAGTHAVTKGAYDHAINHAVSQYKLDTQARGLDQKHQDLLNKLNMNKVQAPTPNEKVAQTIQNINQLHLHNTQLQDTMDGKEAQKQAILDGIKNKKDQSGVVNKGIDSIKNLYHSVSGDNEAARFAKAHNLDYTKVKGENDAINKVNQLEKEQNDIKQSIINNNQQIAAKEYDPDHMAYKRQADAVNNHNKAIDDKIKAENDNYDKAKKDIEAKNQELKKSAPSSFQSLLAKAHEVTGKMLKKGNDTVNSEIQKRTQLDPETIKAMANKQ